MYYARTANQKRLELKNLIAIITCELFELKLFDSKICNITYGNKHLILQYFARQRCQIWLIW